jgi:DNA-binding NarL/FixJ family response regulator
MLDDRVTELGALDFLRAIHTAEKYLSNIYKKLGVTSRTEAILWWLEKSTDFRT